ncbi:MAG: hypothetical protein WBA05_09185 [Gordonia sp. (in: high G+C Gram-positive bacteria)]|uniref:LGFP repeat-containing protein n=1 Tax=Gordonia TaxID=2053 RepID=UPI003266A257
MKSIAYGRLSGTVVALAALTLAGTACGDDGAAESVTATSSSAASSSATSSSTTTQPSAAPKTRSTSASSPAADSSEPVITRPAESAARAAPKSVTVTGERGVEVTMVGPIAQRYASATPAEKKLLGLPLTGDHNAGTRDSGVVFQQFQGGVITARNAEPGTPAFITSGRIRDAWNVVRDESGVPSRTGANGSAGPLGAVTSDEIVRGDVHETTFENGTVSYNAATGAVTVKVGGKVVPAA